MKLFWGLWGLFVGFLVLLCLTPKSQAPVQAAADPGYYRSGERVRITNAALEGVDPGDSLWLYVDRPAFDRAVKAAAAGDTVGLGSLAFSGQAFNTKACTAIVLEHDLWNQRVQVRLTSGMADGRAGWVPARQVSRTGD